MDDSRDFLNRLVGEWMLTGKMGEVDLRQDVSAYWTLNDHFLRLYFKSTTPADNPTSDYEAVYHIGFNEEQNLYVLHLLDTTEVATTCDVGRGKREGNQVPFLFQYGDTQFFNIFVWHPNEGRWSFRQEYEEGQEVKVFARKEMVRLS